MIPMSKIHLNYVSSTLESLSDFLMSQFQREVHENRIEVAVESGHII